MRNATDSYGSAATLEQAHQTCGMNEGHTYDEILVGPIRGLPLLFPCTHKPSTGFHAIFNLWKMNLDHHTFFAHHRVSYFCYTISRSTNFKEHFANNSVLVRRGNSQLGILSISRSSTSKVSLVLFTLSMSKI